VFRTPGEKWYKDCIHGVTKGPGIKLIGWACIWGKIKVPRILIFDKSVNRFVYIGVLEDGLVDVWQEVQDTVGDPILQQDGAKIHTARDTNGLVCRKQHTGYGMATQFPRPQSY